MNIYCFGLMVLILICITCKQYTIEGLTTSDRINIINNIELIISECGDNIDDNNCMVVGISSVKLTKSINKLDLLLKEKLIDKDVYNIYITDLKKIKSKVLLKEQKKSLEILKRKIDDPPLRSKASVSCKGDKQDTLGGLHSCSYGDPEYKKIDMRYVNFPPRKLNNSVEYTYTNLCPKYYQKKINELANVKNKRQYSGYTRNKYIDRTKYIEPNVPLPVNPDFFMDGGGTFA